MNILSRKLIGLANRIHKISLNQPLKSVRKEFSHLPFSELAIQKLIDDYSFETVLDIGCGEGLHAEVFIKNKKKLTAIDYGESVYFKKNRSINSIVADFNNYNFEEKYDCIWVSHVLEHQLNPHDFLKKINSILKEGGILAITVPPMKEVIVGGHVGLWNAGLVLYHLVLAGFDCKNARILCYGYNISIILEKENINILDCVEFDSGDIRKIKSYLPKGIKYLSNSIDDPFDGNISELNWN